MATFHCNASVGSAGSAGSHCAYVMGLDQYADKDEVVKTGFGNLPDFAKNSPQIFFKAADEFERETKKVINKKTGEVEIKNAQAYHSLIIAIPLEAKDPEFWSKELVKKIAGDQPYAYGVHMKDGNPHLHMMFSARTPSPHLSPEKFFSRANKKDRSFSDKKFNWLEKTKATYLDQIRTVAPNYSPKMTGGKEKQHARWQTKLIDQERESRVLPGLKAERSALDFQISAALQKEAVKPSTKEPVFSAAFKAQQSSISTPTQTPKPQQQQQQQRKGGGSPAKSLSQLKNSIEKEAARAEQAINSQMSAAEVARHKMDAWTRKFTMSR